MGFFGNKDNDSKCLIKRVSNKRKQALANREAELLNIAEQLVSQEGFANFTMDKLTSHSDYSKGTIYNHFNSKEDLITALCIKSLKSEIALFQQAVEFGSHTREKCLAIFHAYQKHAFEHPTLFMCVLSAKTPAVIEKSSKARLEEQERLTVEVTEFCDQIFIDAITDKSLSIKPPMELSSLVFAIWAMAFGTNALMVSASDVETISRLQGQNAPLDNFNLLLDGMGWLPLSQDWDYQQSWDKLEQQFNQTRAGSKS